MSDDPFINYGPDWPPPYGRDSRRRKKRRARRRVRRLLGWAAFWIALYSAIAIGGLVGIQLRIDAQPVQGAEVDVTTTVGPPPAKIHHSLTGPHRHG
jgi:hypothetical protein